MQTWSWVVHGLIWRRTCWLVIAVIVFPVLAHAAKNRITGSTTTCAEPGALVTITGKGLKPGKVQVAVGDLVAQTTLIDKQSLTFVVPAAATPGSNVVRLLTITGKEKGSLPLQVGRCTGAETKGFLLSGKVNSPARSALFNVPPEGVDDGQIENGIILTRLDIRLAPGATVGQVNAALLQVNAGIASMLADSPAITIAIPRPADVGALRAVAEALNQAPGISRVSLARVTGSKLYPPSTAGELINASQLDHLITTRFPAAWNAAQLATNGCAARRVPVLITDNFQVSLPATHSGFTNEIPNFVIDGSTTATNETHGYDVTTTLAALFDSTNPTGANPFRECLQIQGVELHGLSGVQRNIRMLLAFPPGKFIWNYSQGYADTCATNGCAPEQVGIEFELAVTRAYDAADWKLLTSSRWDDFLVCPAAGNERNDPGTLIYTGLGVAAFDAPMNVATLADPLFGFVSDGTLWSPQPGFTNFPSMVATTSEVDQLTQYLQSEGADALGAAENVLIVGSVTPGQSFDDLTESDFSDSGADVYAIGEDVFTFAGSKNGTSHAAPQVAGLASYLWLLSDELRNQPAAITKHAIVANARNVPQVEGSLDVMDAYATILSLDKATLPNASTATVRLTLLDVNDDGKFDETDIGAFLDAYVTNGVPVTPIFFDYGRLDLNGDGLTGGLTTERFDLDRVGSTQFGQTLYSEVTQNIEGKTVTFDESDLTDLQVLCYYAYSALYSGDPDIRSDSLGCLCGGGVQILVSPTFATLNAGAGLQYNASVSGCGNTNVTWTATGGFIDENTGFYIAGITPGTFAVTATSVFDTNSTATAPVTIVNTNNQLSGQITLHAHEDFPGVGSEDTSISATMNATISNDFVTVCQATGTGTYSAEAPSGCNRPPEVKTGQIVGCSMGISTEALLNFTVSGTQTHTTCTNSITQPFLGTLPDGLFQGTIIRSGNIITAIDFNQTQTNGNQIILTTGRLEF